MQTESVSAMEIVIQMCNYAKSGNKAGVDGVVDTQLEQLNESIFANSLNYCLMDDNKSALIMISEVCPEHLREITFTRLLFDCALRNDKAGFLLANGVCDEDLQIMTVAKSPISILC